MAGPDVLVWLDMEMTGLDPDRERIIEVATILTDGQLNEIAIGPVSSGWVATSHARPRRRSICVATRLHEDTPGDDAATRKPVT